MQLNQQAYDMSQLILKYFSPKIKLKKTTVSSSHSTNQQLPNQAPLDPKLKYSLDYNKFRDYLDPSDRSQPKTAEQIEMEKLIESNPYLSQIACTHDRRKEREIYDRPTSEKLDNAEYFKNEGNAAFRNAEYDKASYFYQKALLYFDYTFPDTEDENRRYSLLQEQCNNNMAQCKLLQKQYDEALNYCYQVLKLNPRNVKAKLRKAQIALIRDNYDECDLILKDLDLNDTDVRRIATELQEKRKRYAEKSKLVYQQMFSQ